VKYASVSELSSVQVCSVVHFDRKQSSKHFKPRITSHHFNKSLSSQQAKSMPASTQVLNTAELLQLILSHFDQEELLRLARVNRKWKAVIYQ
jgi:hypothetical protein